MLIVLYGTSSSGKTSLAKALQTLWPSPLLHIEADRFVPTIAAGRVPDDDEDFRTRFLVAMHQAIAAFGHSGIDTIADGSLPGEPALRDRCFAILRGGRHTKVVAVRCSVDVLREREAARAHPVPGWAEQQYGTIYEGVAFDYEIDTTSDSPEESARRLLRELIPG